MIVSSDETPLIFAGDYGRQKVAVIGFDLSESDLPLKKDFPIFIYDIINNFFPNGAVEGGSVNMGESVESVSYTHLDEYKRQALQGSLPLIRTALLQGK